MASSSSLASKASFPTPKAKAAAETKSDADYEVDEYEVKREMWLRRKQAELRTKIGACLAGIELTVTLV